MIFKRGEKYFGSGPCTWVPVTRDGERTARVVCPSGHAGVIDGHKIADDGKVMPSVICIERTCDFHGFIVLESWPAEEWR